MEADRAPCPVLHNPKSGRTYEIAEFHAAIGKLVLRSEYGIEIVATVEQAERDGYIAARGWKARVGEGRMKYTVDR